MSPIEVSEVRQKRTSSPFEMHRDLKRKNPNAPILGNNPLEVRLESTQKSPQWTDWQENAERAKCL
jgi:hypothetical protein